MNERKFKTAGGGVVTWTHTDYVANGRTMVGTFSCTGCRVTSTPVQWRAANDHAGACRQIP